MKRKHNKELLNEELKRFNQINEYDFYIGEDKEEHDDVDNLILGEEGEEDELPADDSKTAEMGGDDISDLEGGEDELPVDDMGPEDEFSDDELPVDDMEPSDDEIPEDGFSDDEIPVDNMESSDDEVELDVTELVSGTEEAKESADMANQKLDQLMGVLDQLDQKMASMDGITNKIDNLENELEKRAPTPDEKLEMRSLDSYPYNLRLTDFWSDKEGQYDVMGVNDDNQKEVKPEEYTLTMDDINSDYNESSVKSTFDDNSEYEEEDIM